jgi:hypothetical protein
MPRRCPPGVFCIENMTIVFICVIFIIIGVCIYANRPNSTMPTSSNAAADHIRNNILVMPPPQSELNRGNGNDVFFDIYKAPLRDDRFFTAGSDVRGVIPINVSTQGVDDAKYRQVGILTRLNGNDETILPLMGRPLFTRRDKWNFYTLNDKNNMIKLPVTVKGRSGTDEYGCDNVYNGDTVYVEGYNGAFKVTAYDNQVMRYLPSM